MDRSSAQDDPARFVTGHEHSRSTLDEDHYPTGVADATIVGPSVTPRRE